MKLAEARIAKLLSVNELAEKAGIHRATVYSVESGARVPTMETIRKLYAALEIEDAKHIDEFREAIERSLGKGAPTRISA